MKKSALILIFILISSLFLFGMELTMISQAESSHIALNWLHFINTVPLMDKSEEYRIRFVEQIYHDQDLICEVYHLYPYGHILIPSYKEFPPIKSFSVITDFDPSSSLYAYSVLGELKAAYYFLRIYQMGELSELENCLAENVDQWNELFEMDLTDAEFKANKFQNEGDVVKSEEYIFRDEDSIIFKVLSVSPLLRSKWNQNAPYWNDCPLLSGQRCYVGCTATAMAQIMRYYKHPKSGSGSHSYYWARGGKTLYADFSDSYNWNNMPYTTPEYNTPTEKAAVAELCYEVGVSVDMNYGTSGSGAYIRDVATALKQHFKYSSDVNVVYRNNMGADPWFNILKYQIDQSLPLEFAIYSALSGHAVVVDGYITGSTNKVHINMGWGGSSDGYYHIDNILNYTKTDWQHAVIDIHPPGSTTYYDLTISTGSGGTTNPSPGVHKYKEGSSVQVRANPDASYYFVEWTGDASGSANPTTVVMDKNKSIKAHFTQIIRKLTISTGTGGTTNPSPGTHDYPHGTTVDVRALPDTNCRFDKWTGGASGSSNPVSVLMDQDKSIKANFIRQYKLKISTTAGGTTNPPPGTHIYDTGTNVSITAIPKEFNVFINWSGTSSSNNNPLSIWMNADKNYKADFRYIHPPSDFNGEKVENRTWSQSEYVNVLKWKANPQNSGLNVAKYLIFQVIGNNRSLLAEVDADTFEYWHRDVEKDEHYSYEICAVLDPAREGAPASVTVQ